jgi:predicted nuclease of predicted toxin-antitoxin system
VKLLVDQNLPASLATRLTTAGQEAHHATDLGFERAGDEVIFEWCRRNGAVLLTADKKLTKYLATQHASSPSIVIARGYLLDVTRLEADLLADLDAIERTISNEGHAVFSMGPDRPTRAQLLPLISEVG